MVPGVKTEPKQESDASSPSKRQQEMADVIERNLRSNVQQSAAEFDPELLPTLVRKFQGQMYERKESKDTVVRARSAKAFGWLWCACVL